VYWNFDIKYSFNVNINILTKFNVSSTDATTIAIIWNSHCLESSRS